MTPELKRELRKLARKEARINDHWYQPCPPSEEDDDGYPEWDWWGFAPWEDCW